MIQKDEMLLLTATTWWILLIQVLKRHRRQTTIRIKVGSGGIRVLEIVRLKLKEHSFLCGDKGNDVFYVDLTLPHCGCQAFLLLNFN